MQITKRRKYSEEFKKYIVNEYESGKFTVSELSRLHEIAFQMIYRWIYKYSSYNQSDIVIVELKQSSEHKLKSYEKRHSVLSAKPIIVDYFVERVV